MVGALRRVATLRGLMLASFIAAVLGAGCIDRADTEPSARAAGTCGGEPLGVAREALVAITVDDESDGVTCGGDPPTRPDPRFKEEGDYSPPTPDLEEPASPR